MSEKSKVSAETKGSKNSRGSSSNPIVDRGLYCKCGERAVVRVSGTKWNPGRPFYACYQPRYHASNCKFFRWVDEVEDEIAQSERVEELGKNKEDELQMPEDTILKQEVVQFKELQLHEDTILKTSDEVIQELRLVREVMLKTNETLSEHIRLLNCYGIGMALVVLVLLIVLLIVVIVK